MPENDNFINKLREISSLFEKEQQTFYRELSEESKSIELFKYQFNKTLEFIAITCKEASDELTNYDLYVQNSDETQIKENTRFFSQISLVPENHPRKEHLEGQPYLILQGYPESSQVRVFDNLTEGEGQYISIEKVDSLKEIQNLIINFLTRVIENPQ